MLCTFNKYRDLEHKMPSQLQKSLSEYLSKIKRPATPQLNLQSNTFSTSTSWILRGCKHPKTPSISVDREPYNDDDAATLSDVDRFLQENFKSLYGKGKGKGFDDNDDDDEININKDGNDTTNEEKLGNCLFDSPRYNNPPTDLCGSNRFFIARSSSHSLIEAALASVTTSSEENMASSSKSKSIISSSDEAKEAMSPDDFIAVLTYSPSPYNDFRNSMQEMIQARLNHNDKVNWEFMEELLFCYLNLNDKKSYKYILRAFVDMIVVLRENSGRLPARSIRIKVDKRKKKGRCNIKVEA